MKSSYCLLALFFSVFLSFCAGNKTETLEPGDASDSSKKESCSLNPNGDSELARLMRSMHAHLNSIKSAAAVRELTGQYPVFMDSLLTAKPTDSTMVDEEFPERAKEYLDAVKQLYLGEVNVQDKNYNAVVAKCESCHKHYCPGPLGKIRKLYVER